MHSPSTSKPPRFRPIRFALAALALAPCLTTRSHAQDAPTHPADPTRAPAVSTPSESTYERAMRLQSRAFAALNAGAYDEAIKALNEQAALQPRNHVVYYNLACANAGAGNRAEAITSLRRSIELGFIDRQQLTTDPDLEAIRAEPDFRAIVDNWSAIVKARAEANLERTKEIYGPSYIYELDDERRLMFATAHDQQSLDIARAELTMLWDWGLDEVFADLCPGADPTQPPPDDPWVTVVLPDRADFEKWLFATYGPAARNNFSGIGGAYDHDRKQLVAQDLGGTLRHEFFHVLHWRSTSRAGQFHPIWAQEGLCALVEDYDVIDGRVVPVPSWRTNTVKRLSSGGRVTPIKELAAIPREKFTAGGRTMARYAESRAFFLFLYQQNALRAWYAHFLAHYNEDPTGYASILAVLGTDDAGLEKRYRAWLKDLPTVHEAGGREGRAGLGVDIDMGTGDGPVVTAIVSRTARQSALRAGDVIYAVNGRPTREVMELVRVLGSYAPGERVTLSLRRGSRHLTAEIPLVDISNN